MTKREREITDEKELQDLLEDCLYLHLGLVDDGKPYIVPMNYGVDEREGKKILYLHSAHVGRKLDIIRKNPVCCFTMERSIEPFTGRVACQYGVAYECLMGTGTIFFVDDVEEKIHGLKKLMKTQTGSEEFSFDERMASIVTVMRIEVDEITGKRRPKKLHEE